VALFTCTIQDLSNNFAYNNVHRYEEFQRGDAANSSQGLVHNLCATPSDAGSLLWACSGTGTASIYNIRSKSLVRKVSTCEQLLGLRPQPPAEHQSNSSRGMMVAAAWCMWPEQCSLLHAPNSSSTAITYTVWTA
jgi:hypothetical protein